MRDQIPAGAVGDAPAVPVTVRQLEAIVRLSEALARLQLLPEATPEHVRRAVALFTASTMHAVRAGVADIVFTEEARAEAAGKVAAEARAAAARGRAVAAAARVRAAELEVEVLAQRLEGAAHG